MTEQEAIELLKYHSGSHDNIYNPKWEKGFLGMLRPFRNELFESNYLELKEIIKTVANPLQKDMIGRNIICDLWTICYCTRLWAIDKGGMLRRNKLISDEQVALLTGWINDISMEIMFLLGNVNDWRVNVKK